MCVESKPRRLAGFFGGDAGERLLAGLLGQHGGVEPVKAQPRVGGLVAEGVHQRLPALVVIDEYVMLLPFDQRQDIEFLSHRCTLPRTRAIRPKVDIDRAAQQLPWKYRLPGLVAVTRPCGTGKGCLTVPLVNLG